MPQSALGVRPTLCSYLAAQELFLRLPEDDWRCLPRGQTEKQRVQRERAGHGCRVIAHVTAVATMPLAMLGGEAREYALIGATTESILKSSTSDLSEWIGASICMK